MSKDPSIPRTNKVNWHYVRDDQMFTMIKLVSRHQNTQQFGAMFPIELTNAYIRNSEAYKEYYAVAKGATPPKTKASVQKTKSSSDTTVTPHPTAAAGTRLFTSAKGKQPAKASKAKSLTALFEVAMTEAEHLKLTTKRSLQQTHISQASGSGADKGTGTITGDDENKDDDDQDEGDDDDDQEEGNNDDQDFDEEGKEFIHPRLSIHDEEETKDEESFDLIPKTPENTDDEGNGEENLGLNVGREEGQDEEDDEDKLYRDVNINLEGRGVQMADVYTNLEFEDSYVTLTLVNHDCQQQSSSVSSQFVTSMLNPTPDAGIESIFETTSQMDVQAPTTVALLPLSSPTLTPSTITTITTVQQEPTPPTTAPSTLLQNLKNIGSLFGFDHRLKTLEDKFFEFIQTNQFAGAVTSIPGIIQRYMDQQMNEAVKIIKEQVKEQVKVQVSKILPRIEQTVNEKLEAEVLTRSSNSSKTSYAVAADLSEMDLKKIIIEKMEGNKYIHRSNEQTNLYKALVEAYESDKIILDTYGDTVTLKRRRDDDADKDEEPSAGSDRGSKRRREGKDPESASAPKEKATKSADKSTQGSKSRQTSASESGTEEEPMQTTHEIEEPSHLEFETGADDQSVAEPSQHPEWFSQQKKPPTPDRVPQVASSQLMSLRQRQEIMGTSSGLKTWCLGQCGFKNRESARDVYSKRRIIAVTKLKIVEWHKYKHLDWITVRRDDDKLYKCKEGDFKRLRIQDIEDMRVEDLQLGVKSYQKKLNLTRPDTYRSNLKHKEAYTAYSNPRGFIYQNKDKQNMLMRIDELHKFSDGTLANVRTALDDRLKGIRMKYLPQTIWRKTDKERAAAMIHAIDKQLKTRRIMISLERKLKDGGEDKKNLVQHAHRKKKATLIVILGIRFTKLIIYYLQRKHKFHLRPDSPLHLPNEEPILGYLKFGAKGTKQEVFGKPIPGNLITADIQGSDPDSHAPKPTKATKKSKPSAPKTDLRLPVTKPASSQQPEPKPAPAKSQGKKRKLVTEISDKPSLARKSRPGLVSKQRKPISSLRSVDESVAEGILEKEPRVNDEEANVQRALEESLKNIYDAPWGLLPPMVIREPESGKYQPLPEVQGKGKEKVTDEQVARDLLTLQTPKKKSLADQYIFQRRTSTPTGSSDHDESSSLYNELGLTDSEVESDEDVSWIDAGVPDEGQARPNPGDQDKGQAGPNPDEQDEGQARPNPGDAAASQPLPSHVVHVGLNLEHMDLEVTDVSTRPRPEQIDEGFTTTAYPKVQENLKHRFGDLFIKDKPFEADNEKTTAETEAESMVSVTIQQDTSAIPPMTTPIVDLTLTPDSPNRINELENVMENLIYDNKHLEERLDSHGARLYTLENLDIPQQVSRSVDVIVTDTVDWAIQAPLRDRFRDLPEADMKEILHQRMWETNSYKTHKDHMMLNEALKNSINRDHSEELLKDLVEVRKKKKKRRDLPKMPPRSPPHQPHPPLPPAGPSGTSGSPRASGSSHVPPPPPPPPSTNQEDWWKPLEKDRPTTPEPVLSILSSDVPVPKNNWASALASTYSPPSEDSLLMQTGDMAMFMDWFCKIQGNTKLKPQDLEGPAFELVKVFHPNVIHLKYQIEECHKLLTVSVDDSIIRHNVNKPLPLGGPPSQVIIQSDFFFNKELEYLRYGSKGSRPVFLVSKMKAPYYPDVGLEQMVPDQMWIEEERKYDIAAIADLNEHIVVERDFNYLYPSDFEDLYLLNLQEDFQLGIESYQTQLNLTKPQWDATGFEYKHDYTINEALDYRIKEIKVNRMNPGLNTRFWTRKDVDRSKEFMFAIQKRLKTRRIFRNLESFVGGRVRDGDYRLLKRTE
nr:hypothetical protein [Tanacetum cinerariifolium]